MRNYNLTIVLKKLEKIGVKTEMINNNEMLITFQDGKYSYPVKLNCLQTEIESIWRYNGNVNGSEYETLRKICDIIETECSRRLENSKKAIKIVCEKMKIECKIENYITTITIKHPLMPEVDMSFLLYTDDMEKELNKEFWRFDPQQETLCKCKCKWKEIKKILDTYDALLWIQRRYIDMVQDFHTTLTAIEKKEETEII